MADEVEPVIAEAAPEIPADDVEPTIDKENKASTSNNGADNSESEDEAQVTGTYIVEKILDKRMKDSEWKYLIKWQGWPSYTNTWEPATNLIGCEEKLKEFEEAWEVQERIRKRALEEIENAKNQDAATKKSTAEGELAGKLSEVSSNATATSKPKSKSKKRRRYY